MRLADAVRWYVQNCGGGGGGGGEGEWLDKFSRGDEEGKVALLLGKGMKGVCNREMAEVGSTVI